MTDDAVGRFEAAVATSVIDYRSVEIRVLATGTDAALENLMTRLDLRAEPGSSRLSRQTISTPHVRAIHKFAPIESLGSIINSLVQGRLVVDGQTVFFQRYAGGPETPYQLLRYDYFERTPQWVDAGEPWARHMLSAQGDAVTSVMGRRGGEWNAIMGELRASVPPYEGIDDLVREFFSLWPDITLISQLAKWEIVAPIEVRLDASRCSLVDHRLHVAITSGSATITPPVDVGIVATDNRITSYRGTLHGDDLQWREESGQFRAGNTVPIERGDKVSLILRVGQVAVDTLSVDATRSATAPTTPRGASTQDLASVTDVRGVVRELPGAALGEIGVAHETQRNEPRSGPIKTEAEAQHASEGPSAGDMGIRRLGSALSIAIRRVSRRALPTIIGALILAIVVIALGGLSIEAQPNVVIALFSIAVIALLLYFATPSNSFIRGLAVLITTVGLLVVALVATINGRSSHDADTTQLADTSSHAPAAGAPSLAERRRGVKDTSTQPGVARDHAEADKRTARSDVAGIVSRLAKGGADRFIGMTVAWKQHRSLVRYGNAIESGILGFPTSNGTYPGCDVDVRTDTTPGVKVVRSSELVCQMQTSSKAVAESLYREVRSGIKDATPAGWSLSEMDTVDTWRSDTVTSSKTFGAVYEGYAARHCADEVRDVLDTLPDFSRYAMLRLVSTGLLNNPARSGRIYGVIFSISLDEAWSAQRLATFCSYR
jgi:hypothetical protein